MMPEIPELISWDPNTGHSLHRASHGTTPQASTRNPQCRGRCRAGSPRISSQAVPHSVKECHRPADPAAVSQSVSITKYCLCVWPGRQRDKERHGHCKPEIPNQVKEPHPNHETIRCTRRRMVQGHCYDRKGCRARHGSAPRGPQWLALTSRARGRWGGGWGRSQAKAQTLQLAGDGCRQPAEAAHGEAEKNKVRC